MGISYKCNTVTSNKKAEIIKKIEVSILAHLQNKLVEDDNLKSTKWTIEPCLRHKKKREPDSYSSSTT